MNCELFPTATGSTHVPLSKIPCAAFSTCTAKEFPPAFHHVLVASSHYSLSQMSGSPGVHEPLFSLTWTLRLCWIVMLHIGLLQLGTRTLHWHGFSHCEVDQLMVEVLSCTTESLTGSIVTRLHCKQFCNCRMLTLVSKFADCYLSGQRRSPLSILHTRLPHCSPPGVCFTSTKFELNRLRRSLPSPPNPLVGFQFCMHVTCKFH